jgi:hypothetical protein
MKSRAINFLFAAILITCFSFAIKQHQSIHQSKPVYQLYFAGKPSGSNVSKKEAADASALFVKDEAGNNYEIKRFRMFLRTKKGTQEADGIGANFNSYQKELLITVLTDTEITFDNIYFIGKSGREVKIDKATYIVK